MTPRRRRRLVLVLGIVAGVSIAGALALSAFRKNVTFFFDPTQVAAGGPGIRVPPDGCTGSSPNHFWACTSKATNSPLPL